MKGPVTHERRCDCSDCEGDRSRRAAVRAAEREVIEAAKAENKAEWMEDGSPETGDVLGFARDRRREAVRKLNALEAK